MQGYGLPVNDAAMGLVRSQLLRDKLSAEHFAAQVPTSDNQVYIMAMLLESEGQADEIRGRLVNSDNVSDNFTLAGRPVLAGFLYQEPSG